MAPITPRQLILASGSESRLRVLRDAGLCPEVVVSRVDESIDAPDTATAVVRLAERKGKSVAEHCPDALVLACDSMLDVNGKAFGKPPTAEAAIQCWRGLSGQHGHLYTGHWLMDTRTGVIVSDVAHSIVRFAPVSTEEILAYVATGEPLRAAGGFTIEGYGSSFVEAVEGSPTNVLGLSMPLFREMLKGLGMSITDLWC